jgi:hypothetical protein
LRVCEGAGSLTSVPPFVEQSLQRGWEVPLEQPEYAILRLPACKPNLCRQRKHVWGKPCGRQFFRSLIDHCASALASQRDSAPSICT